MPAGCIMGRTLGPLHIPIHFAYFPYATGAPPAAIFVVVPRVGGFAYTMAVSSTAPTQLVY